MRVSVEADDGTERVAALVIISWMIASWAGVNWPVESREAGEAEPLPSVAIALRAGGRDEGRGGVTMLAREVRCELPDDAGVRAEERRGVKQGRGRGILRWRAGTLKPERDRTIRTAPTTKVGETTGRGKRE